MAARYQHVTDPIRRDVADRIGRPARGRSGEEPMIPIETTIETMPGLLRRRERSALSVAPDHSSGGCGIRTRAGVNPTRFPNPQTEVQTDPHVFVDACEAIQSDAPSRQQTGTTETKTETGGRPST